MTCVQWNTGLMIAKRHSSQCGQHMTDCSKMELTENHVKINSKKKKVYDYKIFANILTS